MENDFLHTDKVTFAHKLIQLICQDILEVQISQNHKELYLNAKTNHLKTDV